MDEITITLTREEVIYLENLLMLDKLDNVSKMRQNGWSEESAESIEKDKVLFRKFNKAWT